ncbi:DnaJ domain-containing protein [Butyrivibrio fibrisolvens DSM 3071]|uniref:DnaJ domain-containing protein n=1 Tax=Butyrivibrio fibrisolvens DSM 3071 TaxID=1121131 RepID=A0A1M5Z1Q3_BUTFI|nr:DnaJ domain-containing protein [Butyrivibrio fibrisolvens]SHI18222.1 DnaJ domain-containing protein [Butyrivibrio fibrisolvens DSM 3071]
MNKGYWAILQIESTTDEKAIKRAYAKLSRQYHPQEHPEEFKNLKAAYKEAINYAKRHKSLEEKAIDDKKVVEENSDNQESVSAFNKDDYSQKDEVKSDDQEEITFEHHDIKTDDLEKITFEHFEIKTDDQIYNQKINFNLEDVEVSDEPEGPENENSLDPKLKLKEYTLFAEYVEKVRQLSFLSKDEKTWMLIFLRQSAVFYDNKNNLTAYWGVFCCDIVEKYKILCKKKYKPDPKITRFIVDYYSYLPDFDYNVWDTLAKFLFPDTKEARSKGEWPEIVNKFELIRSYQIEGHVYQNQVDVPIDIIIKNIYPWSKRRDEERDINTSVADDVWNNGEGHRKNKSSDKGSLGFAKGFFCFLFILFLFEMSSLLVVFSGSPNEKRQTQEQNSLVTQQNVANYLATNGDNQLVADSYNNSANNTNISDIMDSIEMTSYMNEDGSYEFEFVKKPASVSNLKVEMSDDLSNGVVSWDLVKDQDGRPIGYHVEIYAKDEKSVWTKIEEIDVPSDEGASSVSFTAASGCQFKAEVTTYVDNEDHVEGKKVITYTE